MPQCWGSWWVTGCRIIGVPRESQGGSTTGLSMLWSTNISVVYKQLWEKKAFSTDLQHKVTRQWNLNASLARLEYSYFAGIATKLR